MMMIKGEGRTGRKRRKGEEGEGEGESAFSRLSLFVIFDLDIRVI